MDGPVAHERGSMIFPATTAFYAGLFALIYVGLSGWVVASRGSSGVMEGGEGTLLKRVRSQGNFAEYVPFALLVIALLEADGAGHGFVQVLLIVLLVARIIHPIGLFAPVNSPQQYACRGGGIAATLLVMIVAAVALMVRVS